MKAFLSLIAIAAVFSFASCQKVIDIDLNSKDPKIVIEGIVTDDTLTPQTIRITQSVNFSATNSFPAVTGAVVTLKDDAGDSMLLTETTPGYYQTSKMHGIPGRTYFLNVKTGGKTYTASSKMPLKVRFDSLKIEEFGFGANASKSIVPTFRDPAGTGNNYRFTLYDNEIVSTLLYLYDDMQVDGAINQRPLFSRDENMKFAVGDSVTVVMMCIDRPVYNYFFSLSQNSSGPNQSATPANPVTNIDGATLGYFTAQTVEVKKTFIK